MLVEEDIETKSTGNSPTLPLSPEFLLMELDRHLASQQIQNNCTILYAVYHYCSPDRVLLHIFRVFIFSSASSFNFTHIGI